MSAYDLHALRAPCSPCGGVNGTIRMAGGQAVVRCARCAKHLYNAPRSEIAACLALPHGGCDQCRAAQAGSVAPDSAMMQLGLAL